jgi:hypothetical protein
MSAGMILGLVVIAGSSSAKWLISLDDWLCEGRCVLLCPKPSHDVSAPTN